MSSGRVVTFVKRVYRVRFGTAGVGSKEYILALAKQQPVRDRPHFVVIFISSYRFLFMLIFTLIVVASSLSHTLCFLRSVSDIIPYMRVSGLSVTTVAAFAPQCPRFKGYREKSLLHVLNLCPTRSSGFEVTPTSWLSW